MTSIIDSINQTSLLEAEGQKSTSTTDASKEDEIAAITSAITPKMVADSATILSLSGSSDTSSSMTDLMYSATVGASSSMMENDNYIKQNELSAAITSAITPKMLADSAAILSLSGSSDTSNSMTDLIYSATVGASSSMMKNYAYIKQLKEE